MDLVGSLPLSVRAVLALSALFLQPVQFALPTFLFALRTSRRDGFVRRCVLTFAGLMVVNLLVSLLAWAGTLDLLPSGTRYAVNFCAYSVYLVTLVPAVLACFDMSVWDALFCATAGYTIQNLGSGAGEIARLLLESASGAPIDLPWSVVLSDGLVFAVIALYYLVFIRHVNTLGHLGSDSRGMLAVLVGVILVVIAFDVVIRGLDREGTALGFVLALRAVHATVSFFVLFAEFEMLLNMRLSTEVAVREHLDVERERQYELSRETIAAVNRRVHDMRHKVLSDLSANEMQVSREVLSEIVRDITVYDAPVRTGNDVLDTLLTEKSLLCQRRGITLSCIADGTALAHLPAADLYALFGLLLDGAIERVCDQPDRRLQSISLTLRRVGDLALVHLEHYAGAGSDQGTASPAIREIVERHGGTLTVSRRDNAAVLDAMLPI